MNDDPFVGENDDGCGNGGGENCSHQSGGYPCPSCKDLYPSCRDPHYDHGSRNDVVWVSMTSLTFPQLNWREADLRMRVHVSETRPEPEPGSNDVSNGDWDEGPVVRGEPIGRDSTCLEPVEFGRVSGLLCAAGCVEGVEMGGDRGVDD